MGDIDCDCGDCGDCDCGDCDCGDCDCGDCCGGFCQVVTCNGCQCDCCGCEGCDGDHNGHTGCYPLYFCCITSDWDCCEKSDREGRNRVERAAPVTLVSSNFTDINNSNQVRNTNQNQRKPDEPNVPPVTAQPPTYEEAMADEKPVTQQPLSEPV